MTEFNRRFSIPKDERVLEDTMRRLDNCNIINSKIYEENDGPRVEEVYNCPCGDITLSQKSVIENIENPERGSVEIIHMKSNGCSL